MKGSSSGQSCKKSLSVLVINGFKQKEGMFRMDIGKNLFTVEVVRRWNRMAREALDAPSLAVFRARLDVSFINLL